MTGTFSSATRKRQAGYGVAHRPQWRVPAAAAIRSRVKTET
jgi:hypothetical protein